MLPHQPSEAQKRAQEHFLNDQAELAQHPDVHDHWVVYGADGALTDPLPHKQEAITAALASPAKPSLDDIGVFYIEPRQQEVDTPTQQTTPNSLTLPPRIRSAG